MTGAFARFARDGRGLAAVEFAILAPVLLLMLGCLADFALAFWTKGVLASSVAQGAEYAVMAGPSVSVSAIQGIVGQKLALPPSAVTVEGPGCYCVSGTPATAFTPLTCGKTCPNGKAPAYYAMISARYTYTSLLPLYSKLANPVLVESATARLK